MSHYKIILKKKKGGMFIIDGNPDIVEPCMFRRGVYLSVFYCLFYIKDMSTDLSEYQL